MASLYVTASYIITHEFSQLFGAAMTQADWTDMRNSNTGSGFEVLTGSLGGKSNIFLQERNTTARGSSVGSIQRTFLQFDTGSGLPAGATITDLTLQLYGSGSYPTPQSGAIALQGKSVLNFGGIFFTTTYSSELTTWVTESFNNYTLNSTARYDFSTNNEILIAVIGHDYDYLNVLPSDPTAQSYDAMFSWDFPGQVPRLSIEYTTGTTGYAHQVLSQKTGSYGRVNEALRQDIIRVNGYPPEVYWDLSYVSESLDKKVVTSFITGSTVPASVQPNFDGSGTRLYIPEYSNKRITQISVSNANDLTSTFTHVGRSAALSYFFWSIQIANNGTKMTVLDHSSNFIRQYTLSTGWDISTMSTTPTTSLSFTPGTAQRAIHFNADGTKLYLSTVTTIPSNDADIHEWSLSTPFDLSTAGSEIVNSIYSVISPTSPSALTGLVAFDDTANSYVVLNSIFEGWAFKNGITTSDLFDTTSSYNPNGKPSCNDNAHIYWVERTGTTPTYVWTLHQAYTNVT